ncbi:DUF2795 domain-containing protein [Rugosimonospora africana]|uniref:DUF2795 domain-containing protein n=1 Tax=Rugosimonospora africana TaxID=556532 RepID=A0A8J3R206_9ACTN|nr:DUF2795 domain-containing protein [Rugosimonospora africana]GIH21525.1 hypothetical protein Raf01_96970 [Rugosimonospora africana]
MDMNMMRQQLEGMSFPASKQDMMSHMMQHGASNEQMEMMKKMPMDQFNSMDDVMAAANKMMKMS